MSSTNEAILDYFIPRLTERGFCHSDADLDGQLPVLQCIDISEESGVYTAEIECAEELGPPCCFSAETLEELWALILIRLEAMRPLEQALYDQVYEPVEVTGTLREVAESD